MIKYSSLTNISYYGINDTMVNIITTNVRMRSDDLLQIKAIAAESGMSFNEYVNLVLRQTYVAKSLGISSKTKSPIWSLPSIAAKSNSNDSSISEDDKIIYG